MVDKLVGGVSGLLKNRKVTVLGGVGRLGPDRTVTVTADDGSTTELTGRHIVLASGSVPRMLPASRSTEPPCSPRTRCSS